MRNLRGKLHEYLLLMLSSDAHSLQRRGTGAFRKKKDSESNGASKSTSSPAAGQRGYSLRETDNRLSRMKTQAQKQEAKKISESGKTSNSRSTKNTRSSSGSQSTKHNSSIIEQLEDE